VVPITVLEELDQFKKGSSLINLQAREFMRELDKISGDKLTNNAISLGKDRGTLTLELGKSFTPEMKASFTEQSADNKILAVAAYYHKQFPDTQTILVTQDINFRMKAKSLGIMAQDYETGKVRNLEALERGISICENIDDKLISEIYKSEEGVKKEKFDLEQDFKANEYSILKGASSSVLTHYHADSDKFTKVEKVKVYGISPRNAEQTFAIDALMDPNIKLVTLMGKAGTGKTLLALAAALEQRKDFQQILLARPIVPLANRDLGY